MIRKIVIFLVMFKFFLAIFFIMSLFVQNSTQWTQRQRGFINIPADFSFGSDSSYNLPDTSPTGATYQQTSYSSQTYPQTTQPPFTSHQQTYTQPSSRPITTTSAPIRTSSSSENLIYGVQFDCTGKPTGFYKNPKYCDLFHVCVGQRLKKTYPCPQVGGDRFYYDESTRRCEAANYNPNGCPSNNYYQSSASEPAQTTTPAPPLEQWKQYVRKTDPFTCNGQADGFYPSKWCNVFYRCYQGYKYEFLCAKQTNGDRLWWNQHSTSQSESQSSAQCIFPCDSNRACSSPGGVLVVNGNSVSDSTSEANRIFNSCSVGANNAQSSSNDTGSQDDFFKIPDGDNGCGGLADGTFLPDNKFCNVFHVCLAGKRKDFLCAKAVTNQYELWWNDATKTCEWPCKVKCNKQIYGSNSNTAADIQSIDRSLNGPDGCDAGYYYLRRWYSGYGKK